MFGTRIVRFDRVMEQEVESSEEVGENLEEEEGEGKRRKMVAMKWMSEEEEEIEERIDKL